MKSETDVERALGGAHSSRRAKQLKLIAVFILVAALMFAVVRWRSADNAKSFSYETQPTRRGDLTVSVIATGTLEPTNRVEVGSELSGIIETVEVDYNDRVKVGQVLARLDTEKLEAQVIRSQAALESARARVLEAEANVLETRNELERLREVWEKTGKKAPSQRDLDAADAAFKRARAVEAIARAQVSEAQATLNGDKTDLAKAVIRSPINGIVLTREVEPGQTVAASLQAPILFTLAEDLAQMELHVDVDEADVGQVREGQDAVFTVDAYPGQSFQATVTQVRYGSKTVDGVVTYESLLKVDNSELLLRPGMTATANITVKKVDDAVLAPNTALRFSPPEEGKARSQGGGITSMLFPRPYRRPPTRPDESTGDRGQKRVWILKDGKPNPVHITTGATDGRMTEVLSDNLEPGLPLIVAIRESKR